MRSTQKSRKEQLAGVRVAKAPKQNRSLPKRICQAGGMKMGTWLQSRDLANSEMLQREGRGKAEPQPSSPQLSLCAARSSQVE